MPYLSESCAAWRTWFILLFAPLSLHHNQSSLAQLSPQTMPPWNLLGAINQTSPTVSRERRLIVQDDNLHLVCHDCSASTITLRPPTFPDHRLSHRRPRFCFSFQGFPIALMVPELHLSNKETSTNLFFSFLFLFKHWKLLSRVWLFLATRLRVWLGAA